MLKRTLKVLLALLAAVVVIACAAFGYRAYRQHQAAGYLAIRTPNGIQEGSYVVIGGIPQWVQIRGEDRGNPVLLFLHGGPGASTIPLSANWRPWEKYFTVVQWDQRGAGRTLRGTSRAVASSMTIDRSIADGIELAVYLRDHLHAQKILLVGHSFGSFIGYRMVMRRPDLFSAFVGTGQLLGGVNARNVFEYRYPKLLAAAQAKHDAGALAKLETLKNLPGPLPYLDVIRLTDQLGVPTDSPGRNFKIPPPFMPDYTIADWAFYLAGVGFSRHILEPQIRDADLAALGRQFPVPIFFFEGTEDGLTPSAPVEKFYEQLSAPHKEYVRFEGANHFLVFDRADEFLTDLREKVMPVIGKER